MPKLVFRVISCFNSDSLLDRLSNATQSNRPKYNHNHIREKYVVVFFHRLFVGSFITHSRFVCKLYRKFPETITNDYMHAFIVLSYHLNMVTKWKNEKNQKKKKIITHNFQSSQCRSFALYVPRTRFNLLFFKCFPSFTTIVKWICDFCAQYAHSY